MTSRVDGSTLQLMVPLCRCVPVGAALGSIVVTIAACAADVDTNNATSAVVYAYNVKKGNFQSAAEAFAKHFKGDDLRK